MQKEAIEKIYKLEEILTGLSDDVGDDLDSIEAVKNMQIAFYDLRRCMERKLNTNRGVM